MLGGDLRLLAPPVLGGRSQRTPASLAPSPGSPPRLPSKLPVALPGAWQVAGGAAAGQRLRAGASGEASVVTHQLRAWPSESFVRGRDSPESCCWLVWTVVYFTLFVVLSALVKAPCWGCQDPRGACQGSAPQRAQVCSPGWDRPVTVLQQAESRQPSRLSLRQPCSWKSSPALPQGASGRRRSAQSEPFAEEPAERLRLPWRGDEPSSRRRRAAVGPCGAAAAAFAAGRDGVGAPLGQRPSLRAPAFRWVSRRAQRVSGRWETGARSPLCAGGGGRLSGAPGALRPAHADIIKCVRRSAGRADAISRAGVAGSGAGVAARGESSSDQSQSRTGARRWTGAVRTRGRSPAPPREERGRDLPGVVQGEGSAGSEAPVSCAPAWALPAESCSRRGRSRSFQNGESGAP